MKPGRAQERVQRAARFEAEGLMSRAEREYRAALEIAPRDLSALMRLGLLLCGRDEFGKAVPLFRRAALAAPGDPAPRLNLGAALLRLDDEDGAAAAYGEALAINPASHQARLNLARCLTRLGRFTESRAQYQALLDADPADGLARWNVAALDGLAGDLDAAFAGFAKPHPMRSPGSPRNLPRWRGEPLAERTLLLDAEQGLGDTIMFARLAPLTRASGARVVLRTQPELITLLSRAGLADAYLRRGAPAAADVWYPLAELPAILGAAASLAAANGPYLSPDPDRLGAWRTRLPQAGRLRIGLVWAGNPGHPEDASRSLPLSALFGPLSAVDDIEWVSLQKGPRAAEAEGTSLTRADLDLADFEDTAAALTRLDLLISVDTSALHLAGALGRPVWGLIAFSPDWRWMTGRSESPWYPSLRLFRQPRRGDWGAVALDLVGALQAFKRAPLG